MASNSRYTSQQRDAADAIRREVVEQMHHDLAARLATFDDRDAWQRWLKFASGFHQYSFSNTCVIYMAKPDATLVAGYRAWQAKGHQVRRGETAIKVFAPVTRTVPIEDANGKPVLDANGRQVTRRQMIGVKVASVFDASQVEPPPQVERPKPTLLVGQAPPGLWDSLTQLVTDEGFTVARGDCGGANGYTDFAAKEIRVRADVDDSQAVRTLSHEAAHILTMDAGDIATYGSRPCRGVLEVIAESVAWSPKPTAWTPASTHSTTSPAGPSKPPDAAKTPSASTKSSETPANGSSPQPTASSPTPSQPPTRPRTPLPPTPSTSHRQRHRPGKRSRRTHVCAPRPWLPHRAPSAGSSPAPPDEHHSRFVRGERPPGV